MNRPLLVPTKDSNREMIVEEKIVYVTVEKNYILLKLIDKRTLRIRSSLQQFERKLTPHLFIRIHKNYIVCINYIRFVDTEVTMAIGDPLPISREYKEAFLSHFHLW